MRENNSPFCLEIRTPKGRFEFDAAPDSTISELRARIAEKMETDPGRVQLLAGGKTAPADGSLAEFLTPSPALSASAQPGMGLNNYRIYAICDRPPPKQPETPEAAEKSAKAREEVLDLMPSHIREDLDSGSTRFVDMVASWQHRMLENPENTRLQLQSRETRDLLACMRSPKPPTPAPHGQAPPIGLIGSDALIGEPQSNKQLQELLSKQQQQLNSSNQVANIHQDIKFYQRMMQESMRMPPPPPPPPPQPTRGPSVQSKPTTHGTPVGEQQRPGGVSDRSDSQLSNVKNQRAVEAYKQAKENLQLLQQEAPELLPALMQESGLGNNLALATTSQQPNPEPRQQEQAAIRRQNQSGGNPLDQMPELFEQFMKSLGGGLGGGLGDEGSDYSHLVPQLRDMGFTDDTASLLALQVTNGDLNAAVEILSQQGES